MWRRLRYRSRVLLKQLEPRTGRTVGEVVKFVAWPLAVMTVLHRVFVKAVNGYFTDDFKPVYKAAYAFWNHQPVYTANFDFVDPHYLYPPSANILFAPFAVLDFESSRWLFIGMNAVAILVAAYLLLRMFGYGLDSVLAPILIFGMFSSETVTNTLVFTNVNGCVLLGEVIFMTLLLQRRDLWAGAAMGLTLAVKPIFLPLLLLPMVRGQWKVLVTAIGIPVILTAIAWPLSVDPMDFVHRTLPYLLETRDYFNSSIAGNAAYYGLPDWLTLAIRAVFAVIVAITLWLLYRYYRDQDLFFVTTASGVLLTAQWLLGSLGQMYYSMLLFPLILTVVLPNSVLRNWPAWLAIYGFMSYDSWLLIQPGMEERGRFLEYIRITFGWGLLLIVVFCVLGNRYLTARREGRLADGIDPVDKRPVEKPEPVLSGAQ